MNESQAKIESVASLKEKLEQFGIYPGQPLGGPVEHTDGFFNRAVNNGRTYTDLGKYLDKELPSQLLSFLEIHCQTWADAEALIEERYFIEQMASLKTVNSNLIVYAHAPYLEVPSGEIRPYHFNYLLLKPPLDLVKAEKVREIEPEQFYSFIEALAREKIPYLTVHLSTPGYFLNKDEFSAAREKIKKLARFAQKHGVIIGMETGGATAEQLEKLAQLENVRITWDEEHAILDNLSPDLFPRLLAENKIGLVHLAVPVGGKHNQGELTKATDEQRRRIGTVVKLVGDRNRGVVLAEEAKIIPVMLETTPDIENYEILGDMVEGL